MIINNKCLQLSDLMNSEVVYCRIYNNKELWKSQLIPILTKYLQTIKKFATFSEIENEYKINNINEIMFSFKNEKQFIEELLFDPLNNDKKEYVYCLSNSKNNQGLSKTYYHSINCAELMLQSEWNLFFTI